MASVWVVESRDPRNNEPDFSPQWDMDRSREKALLLAKVFRHDNPQLRPRDVRVAKYVRVEEE